MDGEEPTQATQNILDPRRVGKQNSGFSDEDISDIICVLYPHSDSARQEVQRLASERSPHIVGREEADGVEPDYKLEDHASRFESNPGAHGNHAIILRLSSRVKNPAMGFAFGRNAARCDVVFLNDPLRRVSNIHFRIYVNEYGNVMIEDKSTNGTSVDRTLLTSHPKEPNNRAPVTRWVLSSGSVIRIFLHHEINDLMFRVRIPRRDDEYDTAYIQKVDEYFARHGLQGPIETVGPGPGGHVDLFRTATPRRAEASPAPARGRSSSRRTEAVKREWTGSGKYNVIGMAGRGAFATVYKVTSKYNGKPYAAKELEKRHVAKNGVSDVKVENEMRIMKKVQHPNIVRFMEHIDWDDRLLVIIMEYVPGGDLGKLIAYEGVFSESMAETLAQQLLSAVGYLHKNNITHRDVKPDNILISSTQPLHVKLTDFGLSKMVETEQTFLKTFCGTLLYCAPEVYAEYDEYDENGVRSRGRRGGRAAAARQRYSHAVDIWSLGGVLFYALTRAPPHPVESGSSYTELLHMIMTTRLNIAPLQKKGVSDMGIDFLCRMLQRRPENRATVQELENHPWLGGSVTTTIKASQSDDEVTDEEDVRPSQQLAEHEDDRVSDSLGEEEEEESERENDDTHRPKLFGEVDEMYQSDFSTIYPSDDCVRLSSPRGSSGVLGAGAEAHPDQASDSESSTATRVRRQARASTHQSADQLQSLVENVASQSLGDSEFVARNPSASIYSTARSTDLHASKRKPPSSLESSEEMPDGTLKSKPLIKRLKWDANMAAGEEVSHEMMEEYKLLARMPQVKRLGSGRQIDGPVSKIIYWEPDQRTWHLNYPEMTQLQRDAFVQAARDAGEDFAPGKTPLWELAMKYFPPMSSADRRKWKEETPESSLPDTLPPDSQIVVPVQARAVGMIDSDEESCVPAISFAMTDSLVSFGRGPDNTQVFETRTESRVPKYAFKILLWREGYDPGRPGRPWDEEDDESGYHFWISTKATIGIKVNGQTLPSSNAREHAGYSVHWAKLHDNDSLIIWSGGTAQTKLIFRCFWGGSCRPRAGRRLEMADAGTAERLDVACRRAERRVRGEGRRGEEEREMGERRGCVGGERERSRVFEERRGEARRVLGSRRGSPRSPA